MNRRIALILVLLLLFAAIGAGTAMAIGPDENEASKFCAEYNDLWFDSHGDCVSFFNANNGPVELCKLDIGGTPLWELVGFKNQGQCVSFLRTL